VAKTVTQKYVEHALRLIRVANGLNASSTVDLRTMARKIKSAMGTADFGGYSKKELNALLKQIDTIVTSAYAGIAARKVGAVRQLMPIEAKFAARASAFPTVAGEALVARTASNFTLMGRTLDETFAVQAQRLMDRMTAEIRLAAEAGQSGKEVVERVLGTGKDLRNGVIDDAIRKVRGVGDATVHSAADAGRRATMAANGVNALKWHAILDPKVCIECAERAGKLWDMDGEPIGHDIPYASPALHPWCRCILLPQKFKDGPPEDGGKDIDKFDDWLETLTPEQQNDILGEGRAELWRSEVITTADLINQNGQVVTLSELREEVLGYPTEAEESEAAQVGDVEEQQTEPDATPTTEEQSAIEEMLAEEPAAPSPIETLHDYPPAWDEPYSTEAGTDEETGAPIVDIGHALDYIEERHVEAMRWGDELSAAHDHYVKDAGARELNEYLRTGRGSDEARTQAELLREQIANAPPSEEAMRGFRGVSYRPDSELGRMLESIRVGDTFEAAGLTSVSAEPYTASYFIMRNSDDRRIDTFMEVRMPPGTRAISGSVGERELILDHRSAFRFIAEGPRQLVDGRYRRFIILEHIPGG